MNTRKLKKVGVAGTLLAGVLAYASWAEEPKASHDAKPSDLHATAPADRDSDESELLPGEPAAVILDLIERHDPGLLTGFGLPGLNDDPSDATIVADPPDPAQAAQLHRALLARCLRDLEAQGRPASPNGPLGCDRCEDDVPSGMSAENRINILRHAGTQLDQVADLLEQVGRYGEGDELRELAQRLRLDARQTQRLLADEAAQRSGPDQ